MDVMTPWRVVTLKIIIDALAFEKVEEVYGADSFNGVNAYQVSGGDMSLTIIMDNDKVSSIQYAAIFE